MAGRHTVSLSPIVEREARELLERMKAEQGLTTSWSSFLGHLVALGVTVKKTGLRPRKEKKT